MAFCGECGKQMGKDEKFCPNCGKAADTTSAAKNEQTGGSVNSGATISPHKSSLGMDANIVAAIVFAGTALLSWIPYVGYAAWAIPLVFFFLEKDSKFVRFSCVTALVIEIIAVIISIIFAIIIMALTPNRSDVLYGILNYESYRWRLGALSFFSALTVIFVVAFIVLFIFLAIMAFMYKQIKLPIIGSIAEKAANKLDNIKNSSGGGN